MRQLDRKTSTRAAIDAYGLAGRPIFRFVPDEVGAGGDLIPYDP